MKIRILLLTAALAIPAAVAAQESAATVLAEAPGASPGQTADEPAAEDLAALVREALANNPAVKAADRRVETMRHRVPQARALPDPRLTVGWNGDPVPFGLETGFPPSSRNFGASQTIPYPGKLKLSGRIAERDIRTAEWDAEEIRRRITAGVKAAWFEYFFATRALAITRENQTLLGKLAEMAEVRYRFGRGLQQDVLKAQLELSRILRRITLFEQRRRTARARLNSLLNREAETPLPEPGELAPAEFDYSLPTLYQLAAQNDTALARQQNRIEQNQVAVNLAEMEHLPDFRIGYAYQQRPGLPDTHNITVGVDLPVFYKNKQREGVLEASASLLVARRQREAREAAVRFEVKEHYLAARAASELMQLYSQAVTPQSALALESAMSAYRVGDLDFFAVLDNFLTVLDSELDYYRELANYQTALARLEPLVGVELTQ